MKKLIIIATLLITFLGITYALYAYLMQIGEDEGYEPIQPIHFSHKIHAGDNQISCEYCHSTARHSAMAGIPSLNVCMGCHLTISEYQGGEDKENGYTQAFYTGEIKKLYQAVGWDEESFKYTGKSQPVEWVRIHKLPDFTYFNHSQHVQVGGVACETCHREVAQMEVVYQHSPLTMGWCIECHRQMPVNANNPYYQHYEEVHKALAKKLKVAKLTVAEMGGLECAKCHY